MKGVSNSIDFAKMEESVLKFWKDENIFQKSVDLNRNKEHYVFYDGPPFATGLPHYGHILTSYIKDSIPRYFTMRGFFVDRRWGWDCHGLPVEYEIEKKIGVSGKHDIEEYGIDKFNAECKNIVFRYADEWQEIIERLGRWVDFSRQYRTMDKTYMESVMWAFSEFYKKGLIYESPRVIQYCNRCQTPLSNFEVGLDDAFREKIDPAITIKARIKNSRNDNILVWTTTPWTLPSNVAIAVGKDLDYCLLKLEDETRVWIAKECIKRYKVLQNAEVLEEKKGDFFIGQHYEAFFNYNKEVETDGLFIVHGDFVETGTGTGFVHLAPTYGEDDARICAQWGIKGFDPIGLDGKFTQLVPDLEGIDVFDANPIIINKLKENKSFFCREEYRHNYPHCWRCDHPLIYRAISSWYLKVPEIKDDMLKNNQKIHWVPKHIKDGRFGKWLEGARDWSISRNRYWGSPVPVWKCDRCGKITVPSSIAELEELSGCEVHDLHRPAIDNVTWKCNEEGCCGHMRRVPEVLDCWFESGAMPFAQVHYPFENKEWFQKNFPAQFVVEYIAQTRGWFNTMVTEATGLFNKPPFTNAICHGVVLAEDGRKMSKHLKNYPDPMVVVNKYGSDALRIALLSSPIVRGQDLAFSESSVRDAMRRYILPLWNSFSFLTTYIELFNNYEPSEIISSTNRSDQYILAELELLKENVSSAIESYDFVKVYNVILNFIETLSKWYIRINRSRFWATDIAVDSKDAFDTLYTVMKESSLVMAPFIPFTCEYIYKYLGGYSAHLQAWPKSFIQRHNDKLLNDVDTVRAIIDAIQRIRATKNIKVRHPLKEAKVCGVEQHILDDYSKLIEEQTNVKNVVLCKNPDEIASIHIVLNKSLAPKLKQQFMMVKRAIENSEYNILPNGNMQVGEIIVDAVDFQIQRIALCDKDAVAQNRNVIVALSIEIDDELYLEGLARDANRYIQDLRKKKQMDYQKRIAIDVYVTKDWEKSFKKHISWISSQALIEEVYYSDIELCNPMVCENDESGVLMVNIRDID